MKKIFVAVFLLLSFQINAQSYEHLFELRGIEDTLSNTHLFYRYGGSSYYWYSCWSKSIFHFDLQNNVDSLFVMDQGNYIYPNGCFGTSYNDYEFYGNDPAKFICVGSEYNVDPWVAILRYDGPVYSQTGNVAQEVEIVSQNHNLLYLTVDESALFKSVDGGLNWTIDQDSLAWIDYAMISISKNDDGQIYGIDNNNLVRSEDEGFSYMIVDNSDWSHNTDLFYDSDGDHIYSLSVDYDVTVSKISVSDDNGNPFTWNSILEYQGRVWFANDEINSGEIYYSAGNKIFKSTDFGSSFLLYRQLDRNITGLYKKSGTNVLYASTPLRIYEIFPDTLQVIKSLVVPTTTFKFYPLEIGNRWVYDKYTYIEWNTYHDFYIREITRDTVLSNGKKYYQIEEYDFGQPYINYSFERMDSSQGMIYRYDNTLGVPDDEYLIDDLLAIIGDTIQSFRMGYPWIDGYTLLLEESIFAKWGLSRPKKIFEQYDLMMPRYSLTQDIGLDSLTYSFDFGYTEAYLKGCVINGVVFGDTAVVSVEGEEKPIVNEFKLEQNYPNPFNPSTKIKFTIPSVIASGAKQSQLVTLKVYDVLGNEIATIVNEEKPAGEYEIEFDGSGLPTGIYFYQLRAGQFSETNKMILLK